MCASGNNGCRAPGHSWIRRLTSCLCLLLLAGSLQTFAADDNEHRVRDLYYGHALYHYFQQRELDAITRLMTAAERPLRIATPQPFGTERNATMTRDALDPKGLIREDFDPVLLAQAYQDGGAACFATFAPAPAMTMAEQVEIL